MALMMGVAQEEEETGGGGMRRSALPAQFGRLDPETVGRGWVGGWGVGGWWGDSGWGPKPVQQRTRPGAAAGPGGGGVADAAPRPSAPLPPPHTHPPTHPARVQERRIAAARAKKAEQREFHYKKRLEKKERNARAPAWL